MAVSVREKILGLCCGAAAVATTVTPENWRSWWVAAPLWLASGVFGLRYLFEDFREADTPPASLKPSVLLTYESPSLHGRMNDVPVVPVGVHNEGHRAALEVEIQPVCFDQYLTMECDCIRFIGPLSHVDAKIRIYEKDDDGGMLFDIPSHLGYAVARARMRQIVDAAENGEQAQTVMSWPLTVKYIDADNNKYLRQYDIQLDRSTMRAALVFKQ